MFKFLQAKTRWDQRQNTLKMICCTLAMINDVRIKLNSFCEVNIFGPSSPHFDNSSAWREFNRNVINFLIYSRYSKFFLAPDASLSSIIQGRFEIRRRSILVSRRWIYIVVVRHVGVPRNHKDIYGFISVYVVILWPTLKFESAGGILQAIVDKFWEPRQLKVLTIFSHFKIADIQQLPQNNFTSSRKFCALRNRRPVSYLE